jgi:RNA polymerase sigma-70 factor (ECF subfamily)
MTKVEGRPLDDGVLVTRAQRGDARAYEELVRRYSDIAFRTAYLVTGSAADAEEAAQDAFFNTHRALPRLRPEDPFRAWILTVTGNEARNRVRAASRRARAELRFATAVRTRDAAPSPEAAALASIELHEVAAALDRLGDDDRQVIALRHLLELSVAEAAAALGLPEGTVKSRLARALVRLRLELEASHVGV